MRNRTLPVIILTAALCLTGCAPLLNVVLPVMNQQPEAGTSRGSTALPTGLLAKPAAAATTPQAETADVQKTAGPTARPATTPAILPTVPPAAPPTTPPSAEPATTPIGTSVSRQNAVKLAKDYLRVMPFSKTGLIRQLKYEGISDADALYGAENAGADWLVQAEKAAANYLAIMPFSYDSLVSQLLYEGFTEQEAHHGASHVNLDNDSSAGGETVSQQNALRAARQYVDIMAFSRQGLIRQLEYEGYSTADATYGVDRCGADWFQQAEKSAAQYLSIMAFSRQGLIQQLEYEGYTHEQAVYGVDKTGLK